MADNGLFPGEGKAVRRIAAALRHLAPVDGTAAETPALNPCREVEHPWQSKEKHHGGHHDGEEVYTVSEDFSRHAHIKSRAQYEAMYWRSIEDPDGFWGSIAGQFYWQTPWDVSQSVCSYNFDVTRGPIRCEWFRGGKTNICFNAVDRHVWGGKGRERAFLWEGNDKYVASTLTWNDVLGRVCQLANFLRSVGVTKGDPVAIYMPLIPELPIAMLACARIGAVHSVVFGGFSAESLAGRIIDCRAQVLLTANGVRRGDKLLNLKKIADDAVDICDRNGVHITTCLTYEHSCLTRDETLMKIGRDLWWQEEVAKFPTEAAVEWMDSEDPLFMLYTSGSTGKPKGVLHTTAGYMVYAATTFKYIFDYHQGDVFWCTADCGWITGHTYLTYGPLLNGAPIVLFEGIPTYPDPGVWWRIVDKYKVNIFYTAPTAIRSLEREGDHWVKQASRSSLRVLGSVGEPINPKAWRWYFDVVGESRCPIVDTWWQTETGGIMITPLPGAWPLKPGSATLPFFGVQPVLLDQQGREQHEQVCDGYLCLKGAWPGMARTLWGDHARFEQTYFGVWKGYYTTGDGARRDKDGYIWLTGRVDDVINVSGHRISTEEVESALQAHPDCAEAAVVGFDHEVKGQGIYAFVTLMTGHESASNELKKSLRDRVRTEIGPFAAPDVIHWAPALPKTRSGKIMRRILRKIAANKIDELGDISSLANPGVVAELIELRDK